MAILGPCTGDPDKAYSYLYGPHWEVMNGYRMIEGKDSFNHYFGGQT